MHKISHSHPAGKRRSAQKPEGFFEKERIKELEKNLIRAEAERDVFQKLYKEQLAIS